MLGFAIRNDGADWDSYRVQDGSVTNFRGMIQNGSYVRNSC